MDKKCFVETMLSDTIVEATVWIDHLEYNEDEEVVTVVCENGCKYRVNVACNSKAAIILDVIKEVLRH